MILRQKSENTAQKFRLKFLKKLCIFSFLIFSNPAATLNFTALLQ